jgi:predicted membrane channel-forming protein YqfA (hemolysin III family)
VYIVGGWIFTVFPIKIWRLTEKRIRCFYATQFFHLFVFLSHPQNF